MVRFSVVRGLPLMLCYGWWLCGFVNWFCRILMVVLVYDCAAIGVLVWVVVGAFGLAVGCWFC